MDEVKKCKQCGDPVPAGKELCWCCEHTPKLHKPEKWAKYGDNNGGMNDGKL